MITILDLAAEDNMTAGQIAREVDLIHQRLNDLCNRSWGITAGEVVRRVRAGEEIPNIAPGHNS